MKNRNKRYCKDDSKRSTPAWQQQKRCASARSEAKIKPEINNKQIK